MHFSIYADAGEFLARTHSELENAEATNNLLLGLADRLVTEPNFYGKGLFFATVESEKGGALLAAALRTPRYWCWYRDFTMEALPAEKSISKADALRNLSGKHLWEDNGCPVSMARIGRRMPHGATVEPVYTPPEFRGCGYASNCVAEVSRIILCSGCEFCALFTNLANPTSNHIYPAIGYQPLGDFHKYRFESIATEQIKNSLDAIKEKRTVVIISHSAATRSLHRHPLFQFFNP